MIRALPFLLLAAPAQADMLLAARTIPAGTVLAETDVVLQGGFTPGGVDNRDEAIGQETLVALYAGRPIRSADLGTPAVVERNAIIPLIYAQGTLFITTEGRALDRAGAGDVIRVMNLASRTTVSAMIAPDGTAHVSN